MIALLIVGTLVGAVLGMRYTVLSLVPATLLLLAVAAVSAWAGGSTPERTLAFCFALVVTVQLGYAAAVGVNSWLVVNRLRLRKAERAAAGYRRATYQSAVGCPPAASIDNRQSMN